MFQPGFLRGRHASLTFLQAETPSNTGGAATFTFSGVNIGAASADRYVVVVTGGRADVVPRTLNTITIGGSGATIHANANTNNGVSTCICGIAGLLVTSGATATIVINFSAAMQIGFCAVYIMRGLVSTTPSATKTTTSNAATLLSDTIDIPASGILITGHFVSATSSFTEGGMTTEDSDQGPTGSTLACASSSDMAAETGHAYSGTSAASSLRAMAATAWH